MASSYSSLFDHPNTYGLIITILYILYLDHLLTVKGDEITVLPNLLYFSILGIGMLLHTVAFQEVEHHDISGKSIAKMHLLALLPFLLGYFILSRQVSIEKRRKNDEIYLLGLIFMKYTFLLLSFSLFLFIVLVLLRGIFTILFLPFASSLGIIGLTFGLWITQIVPHSTSKNNQFRDVTLRILALFTSTKSSRFFLLIATTIFVMIALIADFRSLPHVHF